MDAEIRTLEAQPTMVVRALTTQEGLGDAFMTHLPAVFGYVTTHGGEVAGPPIGRYLAYEPGKVDVEIGLPVRAPLGVSGNIVASEIPAGRYAVAVHRGSYDSLSETYDALYEWARANGHTTNGAPYESYVDDPEGKDPAEVRTEVLVPLE
ncbi:MAG: GyrI-like domain-containing protein [Actinobacteria bacterium]|nr:GyrI-like domain-containing protein [Actinomycetota bacterium]